MHSSVLGRAIPSRRAPDFHAVHTEYNEYQQQALAARTQVPLILPALTCSFISKLDIRPENQLKIVFSPACGERADIFPF